MIIRKATIDDLDVIVKYNYLLAKDTEDKELNIETLTRGVEGMLTDPKKGAYYVCEIDNKVVGQLMYTFEWSDWRNGNFLWVQSVYVHKEYRGKGIFTALYKNVENLAKSNASCGQDNKDKVIGIRLYVEFENESAQKVYEKLGMTRCHYYMYETEF